MLVCLGCHRKVHRPGGLNNRNLFLHRSGGWKSRVKLSGGLVSLLRPLSLTCKCCCLSVSSDGLLCACVCVPSRLKRPLVILEKSPASGKILSPNIVPFSGSMGLDFHIWIWETKGTQLALSHCISTSIMYPWGQFDLITSHIKFLGKHLLRWKLRFLRSAPRNTVQAEGEGRS